jgi:hypothetical protein
MHEHYKVIGAHEGIFFWGGGGMGGGKGKKDVNAKLTIIIL